MQNKEQNNDIDLDSILGNMSSINSEDYWFKKVSDVTDEESKADSKTESK